MRSKLPSLRSIETFIVAAETSSFRIAAAHLNVTISAVSHRIKALESEIGVPLFERLTRGLELTQAGAALAHRLNAAIADISRTIAELDRVGEARSLRVTMLPSVASRWLMPRLSRFCQLHPDVHVQIVADARILDAVTQHLQVGPRVPIGGGGPDRVARLVIDDEVAVGLHRGVGARMAPGLGRPQLGARPVVRDDVDDARVTQRFARMATAQGCGAVGEIAVDDCPKLLGIARQAMP